MVNVRKRYPAEALRSWLTAVFMSYGMVEADAAVGADVLLDADLTGVETHGLSNLGGHWHYTPGLETGAVTARPDVTVLRESPVTAAWESGRGFGPVVAHRAMSAAIDKSETSGLGMITVRDGCHFGTAGYFARMAAQRGLIGIAMAHTGAAAVPPGGAAPAVGTNPLAVAAPVHGRPPFVFDMAVTTVAGTKVLVAQREGEPVPLGWIVDAAGRPTSDPAKQSGLTLLGAGPDGGGHKGFGLGIMVDVLSGILSGTGSGVFQSYGPDWRIGSCFIAVRIDAFIDPADFDNDMLGMVNAMHAVPAAEGHSGVLLPGERAAACRVKRLARGIPLDEAVVAACRKVGLRRGIDFPAQVAPPRPIGDDR